MRGKKAQLFLVLLLVSKVNHRKNCWLSVSMTKCVLLNNANVVLAHIVSRSYRGSGRVLRLVYRTVVVFLLGLGHPIEQIMHYSYLLVVVQTGIGW